MTTGDHSDVITCDNVSVKVNAVVLSSRCRSTCSRGGWTSRNERGRKAAPAYDQMGARRRVARKVAAPMNNPAKVRFRRFCCLGVRSRRSTREANPV